MKNLTKEQWDLAYRFGAGSPSYTRQSADLKELRNDPKGLLNNKYNILTPSGVYGVIPLSMERVAYKIDGGELFVRDLHAFGITS